MKTVNDILDKIDAIAADIQKLIDDYEEEPVYEEDYPYLGGLEEALGIVNRHRHELEKEQEVEEDEICR